VTEESYTTPPLPFGSDPPLGPASAVAPAVRPGDPPTSHRAAGLPGRDAQRYRLLAALALWGNANAPTLAARLHMHVGSASKRCQELRQAGLIDLVLDDAGDAISTPTPSGSTGLLLTLTDDGRALVARMEATDGTA
jgi:hypothetical protein